MKYSYSYSYIKTLISRSELAKFYRSKHIKADTLFEVTRISMRIMEYIIKKSK